uniref:Hemolysin expression modulating protein n=4 Tax=Klebsiella pneumoniae TaxID=573 RepID=A0A8B0SSH1_KLEPN|nr:hemolysin expression modulating protein [Klebsiella pneumoniae]
MTKQEWILRLRRCTSKETLERIIEKNKYSLTDDELEHFNAAVDHRLAEMAMGKFYDKKFLQASGNMLNKNSQHQSVRSYLTRSAIMNMIFELIGLLLVVGCAFFTTFFLSRSSRHYGSYFFGWGISIVTPEVGYLY